MEQNIPNSKYQPTPNERKRLHPFLWVYLVFSGMPVFIIAVFSISISAYRVHLPTTMLGGWVIASILWIILSPLFLFLIAWFGWRGSNQLFSNYTATDGVKKDVPGAFIAEAAAKKAYFYYFALLLLYQIYLVYIFVAVPIQVSNGAMTSGNWNIHLIFLGLNNLLLLLVTVYLFSLTPIEKIQK